MGRPHRSLAEVVVAGRSPAQSEGLAGKDKQDKPELREIQGKTQACFALIYMENSSRENSVFPSYRISRQRLFAF